MHRAVLAILLTVLVLPAAVVAQTHKVIFDTDFAAPPQDDGLALILALNSPELDIVGITTVAGNFSMEKATADALRVLEIAGRTRHTGLCGRQHAAGAPKERVRDDDAWRVVVGRSSEDSAGRLREEAGGEGKRRRVHHSNGPRQSRADRDPGDWTSDQRRHGAQPFARARPSHQAARDHGWRRRNAAGRGRQRHSQCRVQYLGGP